MIINCINCNKKFEVDSSLIPDKGRNLRCGSCNHIWFFTPELNNIAIETSDDKSEQKDISIQENISINTDYNIDEENTNSKELNNNSINKKSRSLSLSKFFSYVIVLFISFVALIVLIDTIKVPIFNISPRFELVLFNLFETLQDIKLFIIDPFK